MASCGTCARKTCDEPVSRDPNVRYSQGDIYGLKESVYTPIYDILRSTFAALGGENDGWKRNQRSLDDVTNTLNVTRSGRPAIVMQDDGDDPSGLMVCIATTYSGEKISNLPFIFQHFSLDMASIGNVPPEDHVHALPEWDRKNAYIIAWQFRSTAIREGIWTTHADGKEVNQVLGKDAMEFLHMECERKREEWKEMCKDPAMAAKLETELRKHVRDRQKPKRIYGGTGSRASSLDSVAAGSGVDSPCWRSTKRGPTIPEEPEDSVDAGTTGNPHAPEPWKVVEKNRTGSRYSLASSCRKKKGHTDNRSLKSKQSFTPQPHNGSGVFNFDILRAVRVK